MQSPEDPKNGILLRFLEDCERTKPSHLVLLGDIFDLWISDHQYFVNKFSDIVSQIKKLKNLGIEIYYFEGNHDLHLKKFWQEELRVSVQTDALELFVAGRTLFLEHGDLMNPKDYGYKLLRATLRTSVMKYISEHLPGTLVSKIGESMSHVSRRATAIASDGERQHVLDFMRAHSAEISRDSSFDIHVTGHTHLRDKYEFISKDKRRLFVNLGSWMDQPCYLRITERSAEFVELK